MPLKASNHAFILRPITNLLFSEGISARRLLTAVQALAEAVVDADLASAVDVDGPADTAGVDASEWAAYQQTVQRANDAMRRLETAVQGLFDGANAMLLRAQVLEKMEDGELAALIQDARMTHDAMNVLYSVAQAQASSHLRVLRDTDTSTIAANPDDGASVRTGDTIVPMTQSKDGRGSRAPSEPPSSEESEDDLDLSYPGTRKTTGSRNKLEKIMGGDLPPGFISNDQPSFRGPSYGPNDIMIVPEGVRAATLPALIERLTMHEHRDAIFIDTFMLTFKSFATPDEVLDHLINRFFIQPPETLSEGQFHHWAEKKQKVVQLRVINILTIMLKDGVLEKEDMHVLARFKEFAKIAHDDIGAAATPLVNVVERARSGSDAKASLTYRDPEMPPPPQMPRTTKKLKIQDLDPVEIARQLTIMEAGNFNKIKLLDCLQRAGEQSSTGAIKKVIETQTQVGLIALFQVPPD